MIFSEIFFKSVVCKNMHKVNLIVKSPFKERYEGKMLYASNSGVEYETWCYISQDIETKDIRFDFTEHHCQKIYKQMINNFFNDYKSHIQNIQFEVLEQRPI